MNLLREYLASKKANSVVKKSDELVIGCDTVVTAGNVILGKPHDCKRVPGKCFGCFLAELTVFIQEYQ